MFGIFIILGLYMEKSSMELNSVKVINKEISIVPFMILAILASLYLGWQLMGLRYTNHDDIYMNLYSWVFSEDYLSFAGHVAHGQARLQAYINMPIYLWVTHLADSVSYDVLNLGTFGVLYLSLIWALSKIGSMRDALAIAAVTLLLFPLHYYFTFPQGYPVMCARQLAFAFISAGLLGSYLQQVRLWKLLLSVFLFTCSLWGSEYSYILHPALLVIIFKAQRKTSVNFFKKIAWPYVLGWVISIAAYLCFSIILRKNGAGHIYPGTAFGFDFFAGLKTFLILQKKAFLPFALWNGISLSSAVDQGSPEIPGLLTYFSLWHETHDRLSLAVVFILAFIIFTKLLCWQKISSISIRYYVIFFACLAILPCLVLSGSAQYQVIIVKGYIQGHLASFYIQLGLSGLFFLFLTFICNTLHSTSLKLLSITLSAIILAGFTTTTFIYNNINRQVMSANMQKWGAMQQLTAFVEFVRPDLNGKIFYAPAFWSISGVSSIPGNSPFNGENYWTGYVKAALSSSIEITNTDKLSSNDLNVQYFSTPAGIPLLVLSEKLSKDQHWRITLIASQPMAGISLDQRSGNTIKKIEIGQWKCTRFCVNTWKEDMAFRPDSFKFIPLDHGYARLLAQFVMQRHSAYGHPFADYSKN